MSTEPTMAGSSPWIGWLERWDRQQTGYLPDREQRFALMLDAVVTLRGQECRILDLACGPGSISQRFVTRYPKGRSIGVDMDPVLLELGRRALGDFDGRLNLRSADLADPDWTTVLGDEPIDAALSTTALHWLPADQLVQLYRQLAALLPPGGLFLNGDHMGYGITSPSLTRLAETVKKERQGKAFIQNQVEDYEQWWKALEEFSDTQTASEQLPFRTRNRQAPRRRDARKPGYDLHTAALRDAGFTEVDTIWSNLDNRLVMAVK